MSRTTGDGHATNHRPRSALAPTAHRVVWRVGAQTFRVELARSRALRRSMGKYVYVLMWQLAGSTACLHFHKLGPRLARWLLMTRDRADADAFRRSCRSLADPSVTPTFPVFG